MWDAQDILYACKNRLNGSCFFAVQVASCTSVRASVDPCVSVFHCVAEESRYSVR